MYTPLCGRKKFHKSSKTRLKNPHDARLLQRPVVLQYLTKSAQHLKTPPRPRNHKQVLTVLVILQVSHLTSQQYWNLHLQDLTSVTCTVFWPLPQHRMPHPSSPWEVALHSRPCVPNEPNVLLGQQKEGVSSE